MSLTYQDTVNGLKVQSLHFVLFEAVSNEKMKSCVFADASNATVT